MIAALAAIPAATFSGKVLYMKNLISLVLLTVFLTSCSIFLPHKQTVEQGNIFSDEQVSQLHTGMSVERVKEIMGEPVSETIFNDNRLNYVYTMKRGYSNMTLKRVICIFQNGRLVDITR